MGLVWFSDRYGPSITQEKAHVLNAIGDTPRNMREWNGHKTLILLGRAVAKPGYRACLGGLTSR